MKKGTELWNNNTLDFLREVLPKCHMNKNIQIKCFQDVSRNYIFKGIQIKDFLIRYERA